jgi:transcription antitermination factor NusG
VTVSLSDSWLVARTIAKRERWAAENVAKIGAEFYLPKIMEVERFVQNGVRRREFRTHPLFPAYLFVRPAHGQWHALLDAFGIVGLIPGAGGLPATIKDTALSAIRALENNGMVELPAEAAPFAIGTTARITRGAYTGFTGLVQGTQAKDRIQLLLDFMGGKVKFLVPISDLESAA